MMMALEVYLKKLDLILPALRPAYAEQDDEPRRL
jgi:hypothetical protein